MRVVLAHGASGNSASMRPWVDGLTQLGYVASAIDLPRRKAEDAVSAYRAAADPDAVTVIGGHSYGGRVASLLAADAADLADPTGTATSVAGLILLSYPLHRPGQPDWEARSAHWPRLRCPVLLLSGESDQFARIDLLRRAVAERLPAAQLVTWPRIGHGLLPVRDEALETMARFLEALPSGAG
jgi:predicted alpha/beta-hydrolase family hydrolase